MRRGGNIFKVRKGFWLFSWRKDSNGCGVCCPWHAAGEVCAWSGSSGSSAPVKCCVCKNSSICDRGQPFYPCGSSHGDGWSIKSIFWMYILCPHTMTGQSWHKPVTPDLPSCPQAWHVPGPQAFGTLGGNISFSLRLIEQAIKCTVLEVPGGTLSISCTWRLYQVCSLVLFWVYGAASVCLGLLAVTILYGLTLLSVFW